MTPELDRLLAHLTELTAHLAALEVEHTAAMQAALPQEVREHVKALETAYAAQVAEVQPAIDLVQAHVKQAALAYGRSVKGHGWNVVYVLGKARWDDVWLQGYAATHEEILQARGESESYVQLRKGRN